MATVQIAAALVAMGICVGLVLLLIAYLLEKAAALRWPGVKSSRPFRIVTGVCLLAALLGVVAVPTLIQNPAAVGYFGPVALGLVCPFVPWWINSRVRRSASA